MLSSANGTESIRLAPALADEDDPPAPVRLLVLDQERAMWINTRYMNKLRHRVQKQLEVPANELQAIEAEIAKCERALDQLAELRAALVAEIESEQAHGAGL